MLKSKKRGSPALPLILSLICAFALWLYVISVESPLYTQVFEGVQVELRNETVLTQNGLSILSGYGTTVDLTVTGRRSVLNFMHSEDLTAYADLSTITGAGEFPLEIRTDPIEGITVGGISENTVLVYADITTSKTIPISSDITYYGGVTTGAGYSMGTPYIMPTTTMPDVTSITVKGPVSVLNAVDHAQVSPVDLGTITSSVTYNTVLQLIDTDGEQLNSQYITIASGGAVTVYFPVVTEKEVTVEPVFSDSYDNAAYAITITPRRLVVRGEESVIRNVSRITFAVSGTPEDHLGTENFELSITGMEIVDGTKSVSMTVRKNEIAADGPVSETVSERKT